MRRLIILCPLFLAAALATDVQVIAHRGASWDAPEHTFAAYNLALARGADWIEQDLQMTRDGHLVVLHDDSLDRTARGPSANCRGSVRQVTLRQLGSCEVGSWFNAEFPRRARAAFSRERIPTLDAVLSRYAGRARFYIETKSPDAAPGMEDSLVALLRRHRLLDSARGRGRVIVQSFSAASLQRLHELAPDLRLVQLMEDPVAAEMLHGYLDDVARYAYGIGPSRRIVSSRLVEAAHRRGLVVHAYTVNDESVMDFVLRTGVDGIFTDRPELLLRRLGR